jgi:hypothetical protein
MNFGEWMAVEVPLEKQFKIEAEAKTLEDNPKAGQAAGMLLRQCYYQQEVLQQAVHEIARLELLLMQT